MALVDELESQGTFLFRWRSYLPIAFIIFIAIALYNFQLPYRSLDIHEYWAKFCVVISFCGLAVGALTVGCAPALTSGRNTRRQRAQELNTTGMYSIVRHPLYVGNFIIGFGVALSLCVWWMPVIYSLMFCVYYERIMFVEEAFLSRKFGDAFHAWAANTPAFVPRFCQWKSPALPFSFRNVLKREYTGLMIIVLCHGGVEFTKRLIVDRHVTYEVFWVTLILAGTTLYFCLRALKMHTNILNVQGR